MGLRVLLCQTRDSFGQRFDLLGKVPVEVQIGFQLLSVVGRKMDHFEEAVADFTRISELAPNWETIYLDRGLVYAEMGETEKAIEDLRKYLEIGSYPDFLEEAEEKLKELEEE